MKSFILLLPLLLLLSCHAQEKPNDIQIMKDEYSESWEGNTLHVYFKGNKAFVRPDGKSIEPDAYDDNPEFYKWYREYHYYQYFVPRINYWAQTNTMDSIYTYIFHIKGKYADIDYMSKWENGQFSIYKVPILWKKD